MSHQTLMILGVANAVPDAVILDMTRPAWQELSEELHSIKLMDPIDLAGFNPPQWSTFDT